MSLNRYAKRRDANEPAIIQALEAIGCTVLRLDHPDMVVGYRGQNYLLECKIAKGALKPSQILLRDNWRGQFAIVRSPEEAIKAVT